MNTDPLLKREIFAVTLRKAKKHTILHQKRMKLSKKKETYHHLEIKSVIEELEKVEVDDREKIAELSQTIR